MIFLYLFVPLIMTVCGFFMYKFPPKEINGLVGYRTRRSGINSETWLFANRYCGKLWMMLGCIMFVPAIAVSVLFYKMPNDTITLITEAIEVTVMVGSVIPVEAALRRAFDKNGMRK